MVKRVLLLTSHPLAPPWDSADKQIALSVAQHVRGFRFVVFSGAGRPLPAPDAIGLPMLTSDGRPGIAERAQAAALGLLSEPAVHLLHAVISIGPGFARMSALHRLVPRGLRRPVIHTVPGVLNTAHLAGIRPLGTTVALSRATAETLRAAGFPDVRIVPPGIPLERWPVRERPRDEHPVVLFAGHHDEGGGAEEAIKGVAEARSLGSSARLVLAMRARLNQRPSAEADRLFRFAAAVGLDDLEIRGHTRDMGALLAHASLVVFPACRLAGKADLPLIVLEAMASGRPVIVSDLPGFATLGAGALRVPHGEAGVLGRTIASLVAHDRDWQVHAEEARRTVEARFSERAMAEAYRDLYGEVLAIRAA